VTFPLTDAPAIDAGPGGPARPGWHDGPPPWAPPPWAPAAWASAGDLAGWPGVPVAAPRLGDGWAGIVPPAQPVFVGRARELDRLSGLLAEAAAGRPRIAVIEGDAGLGKSSLISEFLGRHRDLPTLAASGEASEQSLPWGMVRQLARRDGGDLPGWRPGRPRPP